MCHIMRTTTAQLFGPWTIRKVEPTPVPVAISYLGDYMNTVRFCSQVLSQLVDTVVISIESKGTEGHPTLTKSFATG